jgi:tetratricopeptide (TPR) repeat protein
LVATVLSNLADLLSQVGDEHEAEQCYRKAIDINERVLGENHPRVAADLIAYAKLLRKKNRGGVRPLEKRAKNSGLESKQLNYM